MFVQRLTASQFFYVYSAKVLLTINLKKIFKIDYFRHLIQNECTCTCIPFKNTSSDNSQEKKQSDLGMRGLKVTQ